MWVTVQEAIHEVGGRSRPTEDMFWDVVNTDGLLKHHRQHYELMREWDASGWFTWMVRSTPSQRQRMEGVYPYE